MPSRRALVLSGAPLLAGLMLPRIALATAQTHTITMESDDLGTKVWFDPVGLFIQPGDTVRWIIRSNVHTVAAYHPENDGHSLRIPVAAKPWNSGYLVNPGDSFEVTLTETGVYDYYCEPHEYAGMAGRIVVGAATGPGAQPFDYFKALDPVPDWASVPEAARLTLPSTAEILARGAIRYTSA